MQTFPGQCSPERVRALQQIFDAVWLVEVHTGGRRPSVALRNEIARRVAEHAGDAELDADEIERAVLAALDTKPEHSLPTLLLTRYRPRRAA